MERIITLTIAILIGLSTFSQSELDSLLFNKINTYRVDNGLPAVSWDVRIEKMASHHTTYLSKVKKYVGHSEQEDVEDFKEISSMFDRFKAYVAGDMNKVVENCFYALLEKDIDKNLLVDTIFNTWLRSPRHNEAMLSDKIQYGACVTYIQYGDISVEHRGKTYYSSGTKLCATLNAFGI